MYFYEDKGYLYVTKESVKVVYLDHWLYHRYYDFLGFTVGPTVEGWVLVQVYGAALGPPAAWVLRRRARPPARVAPLPW